MKLPQLSEIPYKSIPVLEFRGYNHNVRIKDSEMYDMQNLTSSLYPVLSLRKPRGTVRDLTKANGIFVKNMLAWVDQVEFIYNWAFKGLVSDSPKQLVSMGAYILIFPDKKYYNTITDEFGNLENTYTLFTNDTATITGCKIDGTDADASTSSYVKITTSSGIHVGFSLRFLCFEAESDDDGRPLMR
jgi:hypothetical protein